MAQFEVFGTTGQSTDNLWPTGGAAGVTAVLQADSNTYWIQLTNGTYVRYTGFFTSYSNGSGVNAPSSGTYNQIDITDAAGTILASLTGLLNEQAVGILDIFSPPANTVLGGSDTFTGSVDADILNGYGGNNQFIVKSGHLVAGDVINGGSGFDTIVVDDNAAISIDAYLASISSIERLQFQNGATNADFEVTMNWNQVDGWANGLMIEGRGSVNSRDIVSVQSDGADTTLDLSSWTFTGWDFNDVINISGNGSSAITENVTGSSQDDVFYGYGGADVFNGGGGNDTYVWQSYDNTGAVFDGGAGFGDTIRFQFSISPSFADLRQFNFSSVERIRFESSLAGTTAFLASQFGTSLSASLNISADNLSAAQTVSFDMGTSTSLDLSGITATNWQAQDNKIMVVGDANAEAITGSNFNDVIIGGGGADVINAGFGDDVFELQAGALIGSLNGGDGTDTILLKESIAFDYFYNISGANIQAIEKYVFETHLGKTARLYSTDEKLQAGLGQNVEIIGFNGGRDVIEINQMSGSVIDLRGLTLTNWETTDLVRISASDSASTIWGSSYADGVVDYVGLNSIDLGDGNDFLTLFVTSAPPVETGFLTGGLGIDTLSLNFADAMNTTVDFRQLSSFTSFEYLKLFGTTGTLQLTAAELANSGIQTITANGGNYQLSVIYNLSIDMAGTSSIDLSGLLFEAWTTNDKIVINGDADVENITGSSQTDVINGGAGGDILRGGAGLDQLFGGIGADILNGGADNDSMYGGADADTMIGEGGQDYLDGGDGFDTVSYETATVGVCADLVFRSQNTGDAIGDTFVNIEALRGSEFNDILYSTEGADTVEGNSGKDLMWTRGGNDILRGGAGDDSMYGREDTDLLIGGAGQDYMDGGTGFDTVSYQDSTSGVVVDLVFRSGNTGDAVGDSFVGLEALTGSNFADRLTGTNSSDTITGLAGVDYLNARSGNDTLYGGAGADQLYGGNDTDYLEGGTDADYMDGGSGTDTAGYLGSAVGVQVDMVNQATNTNDAMGDFLFQIENLFGSAHNDRLLGTDGDNVLNGHTGEDVLWARGGNDTLNGGDNNDTLYGLGGLDTLNGGSGNDIMDGGADFDTFLYTTAAFGQDTVNAFQDGVDKFNMAGSGLTFASFTVTQSGANTLMALTASPSQTITLTSFTAANITGADFI